MTQRRGIYIASKTVHAGLWRDLRASGLPIVSTWIDEAGPGESASLTDLWRRNVAEASSAAVVLAYHQSGEMPKGALVEIGAALAAGVPVLWVGPSDGQTVTAHSLVTSCDDLTHGLDLAKQYAKSEMKSRNVYDEIKTERNEQDREWGGAEHDDDHGPLDWIGYIARHAARALGGSVEILDEGHWWTCRMTVDGNGGSAFRRQMIRVAALAVAAIESFDRRAAENDRIAARIRANRGAP